MLAFLAVVVVAVGTMAFLIGWVTETQFRRYALARGEWWARQMEALEEYYATRGTWEGLQETLPAPPGMMGMGQGGRAGGMAGPPAFDFRLTDSRGYVVADTRGLPQGRASWAEMQNGIPIAVDGEVVGYLLPSAQALRAFSLDRVQIAFLVRVQAALWVAALAASVVALVIGGLLFRSIVAPLRRLTVASQAIAKGVLTIRAPVRGRDEVAQLASSFNQMAESLARAEEARRNQTADIAHELRTPLTVLQGTLEAMLDGVYPTDRENLLAALAQVRTLARLVEDLRLLALVDAGQLSLQKVPLELGDFLGRVIEAQRARAQERGIGLRFEKPAALPLVLGDPDRLAQVMGNLLDNALRYVPTGGHVTVQVADKGREVVVTVADDGPGVAAEDLPHLFERFWRGDPARRRVTGGSGLGLSIARHIVEAHGGRIWAGPTPGGGLTVAFTLPTAVLA